MERDEAFEIVMRAAGSACVEAAGTAPESYSIAHAAAVIEALRDRKPAPILAPVADIIEWLAHWQDSDPFLEDLRSGKWLSELQSIRAAKEAFRTSATEP
jgi:hypothetical protein